MTKMIIQLLLADNSQCLIFDFNFLRHVNIWITIDCHLPVFIVQFKYPGMFNIAMGLVSGLFFVIYSNGMGEMIYDGLELTMSSLNL